DGCLTQCLRQLCKVADVSDNWSDNWIAGSTL
ncbi:hypothetical protein A2U01_0108086, partial [Trifolium medium]|nr:hypothetical protein [Trifolium medium]